MSTRKPGRAPAKPWTPAPRRAEAGSRGGPPPAGARSRSSTRVPAASGASGPSARRGTAAPRATPVPSAAPSGARGATPPAAPRRRELRFELTADYIALDNLLKVTGLAPSGGAAKAMAADGEVKVDKIIELRKTCKIRAGQVVDVADARICVVAAATVRAPIDRRR